MEKRVRDILTAHVKEKHVMGRTSPALVDVYEWPDLMRDVELTPDATDEEIVDLSYWHVLQEWMFCTDGCQDGGSGPLMCPDHRDMYPD